MSANQNDNSSSKQRYSLKTDCTEDYITDEGTYHHEFYIYLGISEYDKGAYFAAEEHFWFNIRCLKD